jgi:hypothetical protein
MKSSSLSNKSKALLGLCILVFIVFAGANFYYLIDTHKNTSIETLKYLILGDCIGFTLVAIFLNSWSIVAIKDYLAKGDLDTKSCDYCNANPSGPILCGNCNSVLWNRINGKLNAIAIFIAQHRWSILTGFLALFIFAPVSLIYEQIEDKNKSLDILNEKIFKQIDRNNEFRATLYAYELNNWDNKLDTLRFEKLYAQYVNLTWDVIPFLEEIQQVKGFKASKNRDTATDASAFNYACKIYIDVIKNKNAKIWWKEFRDDAAQNADVSTRKQHAWSLFIEIGMINTILRVFSEYPSKENEEAKERFTTYFGTTLEKIPDINSNGYTEKVWPFKQ